MSEKSEPSDADHAPEAFTGDNVRSSWPFSLHQIRQNIAHCSPEGKEALVSAFLWCTDKAHAVRKEEFARRVGYSDNVIYKMYTGRYRDPKSNKLYDVPADLIANIKEFMRLEKERFLGGDTKFVLLPTSKRIFTACNLARESQTPVFLIGRSHIGKSVALEHYTAENNHGRTVYVRMKAASGLGGMIRRIAERVGVSPKANTADLIENIKNALTEDMLLIIDEMHLLQYTYRKASFFACMEVIREIYDETGCGMVLCGTELFLDRVNDGRKAEMEQLLRRGVHRVIIRNAPTRADVTAIVEHSGLEFPKPDDEVTVQKIREKPYELLRQLAKYDALLAITERLRYARKQAARAGQKLTWHHFVNAHLTIKFQIDEEGKGDWS